MPNNWLIISCDEFGVLVLYTRILQSWWKPLKKRLEAKTSSETRCLGFQPLFREGLKWGCLSNLAGTRPGAHSLDNPSAHHELKDCGWNFTTELNLGWLSSRNFTPRKHNKTLVYFSNSSFDNNRNNKHLHHWSQHQCISPPWTVSILSAAVSTSV